jgi:DNA-binding protein HU-beta
MSRGSRRIDGRKHIEKTMKDGHEVRIPGFGTFKVANRAARKARNPRTVWK